jgi:hypothetical protein
VARASGPQRRPPGRRLFDLGGRLEFARHVGLEADAAGREACATADLRIFNNML